MIDDTNSSYQDVGDDEKRPDVEPEVTVVEVRGEKSVGFKGMKHLQMPEERKDKIHDTYADIIIELDEVKDEYVGVDRAWHIGRVLDEYDVRNNNDMTLEELGAFNTIDDMYARRLFYARAIYSFWPDQEYDPRHSVTTLGELASRAMNNDRVEEAHRGYKRILDADEEVRKPDILAWYHVQPDDDLPVIVDACAERYSSIEGTAGSVKRVIMLLDRDPSTVNGERLREELSTHF